MFWIDVRIRHCCKLDLKLIIHRELLRKILYRLHRTDEQIPVWLASQSKTHLRPSLCAFGMAGTVIMA